MNNAIRPFLAFTVSQTPSRFRHRPSPCGHFCSQQRARSPSRLVQNGRRQERVPARGRLLKERRALPKPRSARLNAIQPSLRSALGRRGRGRSSFLIWTDLCLFIAVSLVFGPFFFFIAVQGEGPVSTLAQYGGTQFASQSPFSSEETPSNVS